MCRIMEEVWEEGREEARSQMIAILLMSNPEEDILYNDRFKGLRITQEEIDAAREQETLMLGTEE